MSHESQFIFYLLSAICLGLAALSAFVPARRDVTWPYSGIWIPLGLLFFVLVPLISAAKAL